VTDERACLCHAASVVELLCERVACHADRGSWRGMPRRGVARPPIPI
jgi:hypothetical protein